MTEVQFSLSEGWNIDSVYAGIGVYGDNNNRYIPLIHWDNWKSHINDILGVDQNGDEFIYIRNPKSNTKYSIIYNDYENKCYFDDKYLVTISDLYADQLVNNLFLFAHANSGPTLYSKFFQLHSVKLTDKSNQKVVRDYIPVIDSTSRPCLFDKVSKECYYNQGTGEFLYG